MPSPSNSKLIRPVRARKSPSASPAEEKAYQRLQAQTWREMQASCDATGQFDTRNLPFTDDDGIDAAHRPGIGKTFAAALSGTTDAMPAVLQVAGLA